MTEKDYDLLRRARMALLEDAMSCKEDCFSAYEWEQRARESEAGKIVGPTEVDRFVRFVWRLK